MPSPLPRDERRRRRALLRAHHPDLGGNPEEFIRVMAAMRADRSTASSSPGDEVRFVRRPRGLGGEPGGCPRVGGRGGGGRAPSSRAPGGGGGFGPRPARPGPPRPLVPPAATPPVRPAPGALTPPIPLLSSLLEDHMPPTV